MARNADVNSKSEVGGVGTPIKARQGIPKRMPESTSAHQKECQKRRRGGNSLWRRAQPGPRPEKLANGNVEWSKVRVRQRLPPDAERTPKNVQAKQTSTSTPFQKVTKTLCFTICSHIASLWVQQPFSQKQEKNFLTSR